jgi:hypothetical protein
MDFRVGTGEIPDGGDKPFGFISGASEGVTVVDRSKRLKHGDIDNPRMLL